MRIERLQFIAEHCPQLRVEALKMALTFVQRTFNVDTYEEIHRKLTEATRYYSWWHGVRALLLERASFWKRKSWFDGLPKIAWVFNTTGTGNWMCSPLLQVLILCSLCITILHLNLGTAQEVVVNPSSSSHGGKKSQSSFETDMASNAGLVFCFNTLIQSI